MVQWDGEGMHAMMHRRFYPLKNSNQDNLMRGREELRKKTWESKTLARKSAPVSEVWFANTQTELHKYTKKQTHFASLLLLPEKRAKKEGNGKKQCRTLAWFTV